MTKALTIALNLPRLLSNQVAVLLNEVVLKSVRTILAFLIMIKEAIVKASIIKSPASHI